jgi:hypothetical protein
MVLDKKMTSGQNTRLNLDCILGIIFKMYVRNSAARKILFQFTSTWFDRLTNRRSVSVSFVSRGGVGKCGEAAFPYPS